MSDRVCGRKSGQRKRRQGRMKSKEEEEEAEETSVFCGLRWHSGAQAGEAGLAEEIHKSGSGGSGQTKGNGNKLSQVLFGKTRRPTVPREQELHPRKPIADSIAFSRLMNATSFPTSTNFEGGGGREGAGRRGGESIRYRCNLNIHTCGSSVCRLRPSASFRPTGSTFCHRRGAE